MSAGDVIGIAVVVFVVFWNLRLGPWLLSLHRSSSTRPDPSTEPEGEGNER